MTPQTKVAGSWGRRLLSRITCPNCWLSFSYGDILFISRHSELMGDDVAGGNEYLRFEPVRFTPNGEALDPRGTPTMELACPRCHLRIDQVFLEVPPLFISLIGSPYSGKSYLLAAMTWQLRQLLPRFNYSFTDADPLANNLVHEYERTLFTNPHPDRLTEIIKTQPDDIMVRMGDIGHYRLVQLNGMTVRYPVPLQFLLWPTQSHPQYEQRERIGRVVVLYDNAGEDCRPTADEATTVQHLAMSKILLALFDFTQDPRFTALVSSDDPQLKHGLRPDAQENVVDRQETILREAARRLRRHLNVSQEARLRKPLIIIVPKFDIWKDFMQMSLEREPYAADDDGGWHVDCEVVEEYSSRIREMLVKYCPDFVATAESISNTVVYIPVSSLGRSPEYAEREDENSETGKRKIYSFYGIRPKDVRPQWVTVPLMYSLCKWTSGVIRGKT